jgi:hypothetical protein
MNEPTAEDIGALKADGDLKNYLIALTGRVPKARAQLAEVEPPKAAYHIPQKGAWPCGTAATGPTPAPCGDCQNTAPHHHNHEGDVA